MAQFLEMYRTYIFHGGRTSSHGDVEFHKSLPQENKYKTGQNCEK